MTVPVPLHVPGWLFVATIAYLLVLLFVLALCRAAALEPPMTDCWQLVGDGWPRHVRIIPGDDAA